MSISKRFDAKKVTVVFYIKKEAAQGAESIDLLCEHNDWQPVALRPQKNGTYRGSITIPLGVKPSYQYRYLYKMPDGSTKYENDWEAEYYVRNPFGGDNSVFSAIPEK